MQPRDWLLLFLAYKGAPEGLDPVRIQKGLFLFAMEGRMPDEDRYEFEPYNDGPMSRQIYSDLDELVNEGLVARSQPQGYTWKRHSVTPVGREAARRVLSSTLNDETGQAADASRQLFDIKQHIVDLPFNELLVEVYDKYPEYAEKSVFRRE